MLYTSGPRPDTLTHKSGFLLEVRENHEILPYPRTHNCIWFPGFLDSCPRQTVHYVENIFFRQFSAPWPSIPSLARSAEGRQQADAPGPALCRPVAIHTRLGVGRAGSQPALPSTTLGVTGHPGPAAEARLVMSKKLAHIYTRLDAAPG